jgi:hypothetical protein
MKALVLIRSTRPDTYKEVLRQLLQSRHGVNEIIWAYLGCPIDKALVPLASPQLQREEYVSINTLHDLKPLLKGVSLIDVSGLPKDSMLQVFATAVGHKGIQLCTISQSSSTPYVQLTSEPTVAGFRRSFLVQAMLVRGLASVAAISLLAYAIARLGGFDSSSPFITWLGVFLGIVGVALGVLSLRRA